MKKHLTMLAAAMLLMSCGGNGSSSEAEASSPKSLEIPNDINTPFSISSLPIDKTDVMAITLDNDGNARISIFGDGEKGISTDELRRMVAIQALFNNGIEAEAITEEQLKNFVSLPDIGMTTEEWAANYKKPLAELKRINAKGIKPVRRGEYNSSVSGWPSALGTVARSDAERYSLKPKKPEPEPEPEEEEEEEIPYVEPEIEEILPEEILNTEVKLWNSNIKPQKKYLAGYDILIISDEDNAYENVENLLINLAMIHINYIKFVTSQRAISDGGSWAHGKRNVQYISFEGIGDFINPLENVIKENAPGYYYEIYPQKKITVIVDNVRDAQGRPVMDESTGRHKLTSWVIEPGSDIRQANKADFSENNSNTLRPTGLRRILYERNREVTDMAKQYERDLRNNRISENEYLDRMKALNREYENDWCAPYVVLKFAPGATYEAFIAAMDEMYYIDILYWRIDELTPEEARYINANR